MSPEKRAFLEEILGRVEAMPGVASVEALDGVFGLRLELESDASPRMIFLDNLWGETRDFSSEERERRVELFVRAMCERPDEEPSWPDAAPRLLPVLRTVSYLALVGVPGGGKGDAALVSRPFSPFLRVGVALDSELTMRMVKRGDAERWGKSEAALVEHAVGNLAEVETLVERGNLPDGSTVFRVASDDSYESSRLTLPGWLGSFRDQVSGRPIAVVPERSQCVVTGDASADAVRYLLEVAEREWTASPRGISPVVYAATDDGAIVPYRSEDPSLGAGIARAHVLLALREYEEQGRALEARFEEEGTDLWVAKPIGITSKEDGPILVAIWPEDVEGLLPIVDRLVFQRSEEDRMRLVTVRWADALRLAGRHLEREPEIEPPRFRIRSFPDEQELRALEAVAIDVDVRAIEDG